MRERSTGVDKMVSCIRKIGVTMNAVSFFAILVFAAALAVFAADTQVPHIFQPGDVITASKINDNFKFLQDKINRLENEVKGVPVGTVTPYAGLESSVPAGWRICNGQELSRTDFPELFAVIGTLWGDGNGVTTFNVPDLRGLFLRGVNNGRTGAFSDPDSASRVDYEGAIVGDRVGSFQDDMFASHNHLMESIGTASNYPSENIGPASGSYRNHFTSFSGGGETRPVNAMINYLIKIK